MCDPRRDCPFIMNMMFNKYKVMEADNYLKNKVGDTLAPIQSTEKFVLFRAIDPATARYRDTFFIAPIEAITDQWGTKLHLTGGIDWEQAGCYVQGEKQALEKFESLTPEGEQTEKVVKYYNQ